MSGPTPTLTSQQLFMILGMRRIKRALARFLWALKNKPLTDVEAYGLRLVRMHARDGRWDLVEEDLEWLGKHVRLDGKVDWGRLAQLQSLTGTLPDDYVLAE